jgi:hypothetical protein
MRIRVAALMVLVALAAPAAAAAQTGNPFLTPPASDQPQVQTQTVPDKPANVDDGSGGLSRGVEILLFLGGVVLIFGIGWVILRDARRRAPVGPSDQLAVAAAARGSHKAQRKAQARAKAKAAKAARRRNR